MDIGTFLKDLADSQARVKRLEVRVEFERDGNRTAYTMSSLDKSSLQHSVQQRMREAENAEHGGFAQFLTPWLAKDGRWTTRGEVVLYEPEAAQ